MIKEKQSNKEIYKEKQGRIINISIKVFVIIFLTFILCGCGKRSLSPKEFTSKMKEKKYVVTDLSNKKSKTVLAVGDHYQVYYYQYASNNLVKKALETEVFLLKEDNNKIQSTVTDKHEKYEVETNDIYIVYSRVDNTYIYIGAPKRYKNEIIDLLKYIGY